MTERFTTLIAAVALITLCLVTARIRGEIHCLGMVMASDREACFAADRRAAIEDARLAEMRAVQSNTPWLGAP